MTSNIELEQASSLLQQGKAAESATLCGEILKREPKNARAAHLLGLAFKDIGDLDQGEAWLRFSLKLEPAQGEFAANLANLLRRRRMYFKAERFYRKALELLPQHRAAARGLALTLCDLNRSAESEAQSRQLLASDVSDAETWVILGMALAQQNKLIEAEAAYRKALQLNPSDQVANHNLGALLARMDRAQEALATLEIARELGGESCELCMNRGVAYLSADDLEAAEREFEHATALQPANTEAQLALARIRYARGDKMFARSLAAATVADRDNIPLQLLLGDVLWRSGDLTAAETLMHDILRRKGPHPRVQALLSSILLEQGMLKDAEDQALKAATALPDDPVVIETLVNILLSRGRAADAVPFIQAQRRKYPASQAWIAYEATAARMLGHESYLSLYDYNRLVQVFDIDPPPGWSSTKEFNDALITALTARHRFVNRPLDQSLRYGTQTVRSLLAEPDPAIQAVLKAFTAPIEQYRHSLGNDASHPLTARNVGNVEFTGAWSVLLRKQGFHVNHFHPDGWISSAYYVDVPHEVKDENAKSGWIKFGEPRYAVPGLKAERYIQPRSGRLVLFPSYMWHGTNVIQGDEPRLTIAFDIRTKAT